MVWPCYALFLQKWKIHASVFSYLKIIVRKKCSFITLTNRKIAARHSDIKHVLPPCLWASQFTLKAKKTQISVGGNAEVKQSQRTSFRCQIAIFRDSDEFFYQESLILTSKRMENGEPTTVPDPFPTFVSAQRVVTSGWQQPRLQTNFSWLT